MKYKMLGAFVTVASNGGHIAITGNPSDPTCRDKILRENVVVHRNDGLQIASLDLHAFGCIIGIEFLSNYSLAVIYSDGMYFIFNPATKALSPKLYINNGREFEADPIRAVKTDGKTIICMTEKRMIYSKDLFNLGAINKIYPITAEKLPLDENNCYNYSVLGARGSRLLQVFLPTKAGGVIKITTSSPPREETLLPGLSESIILTSISPSGANLALLTSGRKLYVLQTSTYGGQSITWSREIPESDIEHCDYDTITSIEWISQFAVVLIIPKKVFVISCKVEEPIFEIKVKKPGIMDFKFFTKSEIDGLRIILVDQSSKDQQICKLTV
jgi:Vps16, N-terminal region